MDYHPASGDIRSDNADGIACWFVDTDYNGELFIRVAPGECRLKERCT